MIQTDVASYYISSDGKHCQKHGVVLCQVRKKHMGLVSGPKICNSVESPGLRDSQHLTIVCQCPMSMILHAVISLIHFM